MLFNPKFCFLYPRKEREKVNYGCSEKDWERKRERKREKESERETKRKEEQKEIGRVDSKK